MKGWSLIGEGHWKRALAGGIIGLTSFWIFNATSELAVRYDAANLVYALAELVICVPAILASLTHWNLLFIYVVSYWSCAAFFLDIFPSKRKTILFLLLLVHGIALVLIDVIGRNVLTDFSRNILSR